MLFGFNLGSTCSLLEGTYQVAFIMKLQFISRKFCPLRYYPPVSSYTITRPGGETAVYSYPVRAQPSYPTMPGYHNYGFQSKAAPVHPGYSTT